MNLRAASLIVMTALGALLMACGSNTAAVPDAVELSVHCREGELTVVTNQYVISDPAQRRRFVEGLRRLDWSQAKEMGNVRFAMPDFDLLLKDKGGKEHRYGLYWRHDSLIDWTTTTTLQGDTSTIRKLVAAESAGAMMRVTVIDESTGKERTMVVADATKRGELIDAVEALKIDPKGVPLSQAAEMRAPEIFLSFHNREAHHRSLSTYQGTKDSGVVRQKDHAHDVTAGMNQLRSLVSKSFAAP